MPIALTPRGAVPRLPLVPAAFFGMVLGLAGLGSGWRLAHQAWDWPAALGEAVMAVAVLVWAVLTVLYIGKWLVAPEAARAEFDHPVQGGFAGLAGVATMLAAGALLPHARGVAVPLAAAGIVFTLGFAVWRTGQLWQGGRDPATTTAVLYLPSVAGSFVTGTTLAALGLRDWGQLAFGMGLFAWFAIESVLLHRLLTGPTLPPAMRPTLGIQLAPPVVGAVSYLSTSGAAPDLFAHALIGYGLLQALLMLRLLPWLAEGGFSPGFWAFSFGATSLANAALILVTRGESGPVAVLAPALFVGANLLIAVLAAGTLWRLAQGRLVPPPGAGPAPSR